MALGAIVGAIGSIAGGLISTSSANSAAKDQQRAQEEANAAWREATIENAENQRDWDQQIAQDSYETSVRVVGIQTDGALDALELEGQALENLRTQTADSYGRQIRHTVDMANLEMTNAVRQAQREAELTVQTSLAAYEARKAAIASSVALAQREAGLLAGQAARAAEERKSDIALEADRMAATTRVAAGEQGAGGSSMYTRMVAAGGALEGREMGRVDEALADEFATLEHGLVVAATNAQNELASADLQLMASMGEVSNSLASTAEDLIAYQSQVAAEIEALAANQVFDLAAIDLEGDSLNLQQDQVVDMRNLELELLGEELDTANDFADFVFGQTERAAEANASAQDALAAANASAQRRVNNASFLGGVASTGVNILGDYFNHRQTTQTLRSSTLFID